jgi:hypothetical protein
MHCFFGVFFVFWERVKKGTHCFFIVELQEDGGPKSRVLPEEQQKNMIMLLGRKEMEKGTFVA